MTHYAWRIVHKYLIINYKINSHLKLQPVYKTRIIHIPRHESKKRKIPPLKLILRTVFYLYINKM